MAAGEDTKSLGTEGKKIVDGTIGLARDADGHCYNVEVQVRRYGAWHKRGLFYLARTLGGQLTAGEDDQELRASVGLHLLDFDLFTATERHREEVARHLIALSLLTDEQIATAAGLTEAAVNALRDAPG